MNRPFSPRTNLMVGNFFRDHPAYSPSNDRVLDHKNAHRWFSLLGASANGGIYSFENVLQGKSGPVVRVDDARFHMMSSYDYLGLIGHPAIEKKAIRAIKKFGTGSGGVRLLTGTNQLHVQLETVIYQFKGTESAMVFNSGYMANIAAITALFNKTDRIIIDEFVHRSILDGLRILGVAAEKFPHNDTRLLSAMLEAGSSKSRTVIIVEGIYSMDGDICPLDEVVRLKEKHGAVLMVDEAHSFGVLGGMGSGVNEYFGIAPGRVDIFTGSLSKAIPANGGFVAARKEIILYLKHSSAPYIFSAALTPAATATAMMAIELIHLENWRLRKLWDNAGRLNNMLKSAGFDTGKSQSPVIPIMTNSSEKALRLAKKLFDGGFIANAVVYPAVAVNRPRLRICCTASQTTAMLTEFVNTLKDLYCF